MHSPDRIGARQFFYPDSQVDANVTDFESLDARFKKQGYFDSIPSNLLRERLQAFITLPDFNRSEGNLTLRSTLHLLTSYTGIPVLEVGLLVRKADVQEVIDLTKVSSPRRGSIATHCDKLTLVKLGMLFADPRVISDIRRTLDFFPAVAWLRQQLGEHEIVSFFAHVDIPQITSIEELEKNAGEGSRGKMIGRSGKIKMHDLNVVEASPLGDAIPLSRGQSVAGGVNELDEGRQKWIISGSQQSVGRELRYNDRYISPIPRGRLAAKLKEKRVREREEDYHTKKSIHITESRKDE